MEQSLPSTGILTHNPPPKPVASRTLKVDDPSRYSIESDFPTPSQKMYFGEQALLILSIDSVSEPLVIEPEPMSLFGRVAIDHNEKSVINLTPYDADKKGVSRLHAVLYRHGNTLKIEDLSSRNGTYVNDVRLVPHQVHTLQNGDELRLGALVLRVKFLAADRSDCAVA